MDESVYKSIFSSTTFWGVVISIISKLVVVFFGVEIEESFSMEVANWLALYIPMGIGLIGDALAIKGRMQAEQKLYITKPKPKDVAEEAASLQDRADDAVELHETLVEEIVEQAAEDIQEMPPIEPTPMAEVAPKKAKKKAKKATS